MKPWLALFVVAVVTGCAPAEVLVPRDGTVPEGVDLSGDWDIRPDTGADQRRVREAIRRTDGLRDDELFSAPDRQPTTLSRRSQVGRVKGGLVFVFLETGSHLKLTQTEHGLFISFDRAVVEEFRFGENRIVSVGEVQAQRVTGWEGGQLVVETLDRNRMKLTERFQLLGAGDVLERIITVRSAKGETETIVQLVDRRTG